MLKPDLGLPALVSIMTCLIDPSALHLLIFILLSFLALLKELPHANTFLEVGYSDFVQLQF